MNKSLISIEKVKRQKYERTEGFNVKDYHWKLMERYQFWELGGSKNMQQFWPYYFKNT